MGLEVTLKVSCSAEDGNITMDVGSSGKFKRKAAWEELSAYAEQEVNSDKLKEWIHSYQEQNFPEALEKPNHRPFKCFIYDEPKKGFTLFKDYGWNPIKLEMKVAMAEVKKKSTQKVTLIEPFEWDDMESVLNANADLEIVSVIKKHKLAGHPLGVQLVKSASEVKTEYNGFDSVGLFLTPTKEKADKVCPETGCDIWMATKTLGDFLDGITLPEKREAGVKHQVVAYESVCKARVYYKAMFTGEISTDHKEPYDGRRFWNFPLKYLFQYNGVPKQVLIYEDVEFRFFSGVSVADVEPGAMSLTVNAPEGESFRLEVKPSTVLDSIKNMVEQNTGIAIPRQVLKHEGKELPADGSTNVQQMGFHDGTELSLEIYTIPLTVKCPDDKILSLNVEPKDTIDMIKKTIEEETAIAPDKQILKFAENVLKKGTVDGNGLKAGSELVLEEDFDPIIFVDIKCGTLFAVDRMEIVEKGILTPIDDEKKEFKEATKDKAAREQILTNMKESPTLGVNPNKVVEKKVVSSLGVQEAESVKEKWGVSLKKVEHNKKGEELYFIDAKTGAAGELLRNKHISMGFITPVDAADNKQVLKEAEKDIPTYDKYINHIRRAFGIEITKK